VLITNPIDPTFNLRDLKNNKETPLKLVKYEIADLKLFLRYLLKEIFIESLKFPIPFYKYNEELNSLARQTAESFVLDMVAEQDNVFSLIPEADSYFSAKKSLK
jgi:hypothetical protein